MKWAKLFKRALLIVLLAAIAYGVLYAWRSFPIISGYSAKNACSCAFLQNRNKESIQKEELGSFPLSLSSLNIDYADSSVTATVWGMAKKKAIFRAGLGCTLINEIPEKEIRSQAFFRPAIATSPDTAKLLVSDTLKTPQAPLHNEWIDSAMQFVFNHSFKEKEALTRAIVVVHRVKVIAEKYAPGYNERSVFLGWSMAKSITSALTGILVKEGKLDVKKPAPVAAWQKAKNDHAKITTEHLLQQVSGIDFEENYNKLSGVTNMLFNKGDMGGYAASLPLKQSPGTFFSYSSGNSNILSGIIRSIVGEAGYSSFPYEALFYKIGMEHTILEPDASGTFVGSSYVYATARDYARFGLLYLNDGVWNGERVLPEEWVKKSRTSSAANGLRNYGYQFWLNGFDKDNSGRREYPEMPVEMFYADGYGGQRIYIVPSEQLVIVRMGLNVFDEHVFLRKLMKAFE